MDYEDTKTMIQKDDTKRFCFAIIWALIYSAAFNARIIGSFTDIPNFLAATGWVFVLFTVSTYSRIFFYTVIPLIFITSGIVLYTEGIMNTPISRDVIAATFQVNWSEIHGVTGWNFVMHIAFVVLLLILCSTHMEALKLNLHANRTKNRLIVLTFGFVFVSCASLVFATARMNIFYWGHPYDYTEYAFNFLKEKYLIAQAERKYDISTLPAVRNTKTDDPPLHVVVIIGEAARADHFGINGYARNTTPLLSKENNLLNLALSHIDSIWE